MSSIPLGVCVLPEPPPNAARTVSCPAYVHEILSHAGLCYQTLSAEELPDALPLLRVLVTVGDPALHQDTVDRLRAWVLDGGAWLSVGGVCGAADLFGAEVDLPSYSSWGGGVPLLGEGYLDSKASTHPILAHLQCPLHYFNGIAVKATGAERSAASLDAHQRPTGRAAILEAPAGKGLCLLIAPDLTGAVVRIQQGIAVTRDGVPAPDGTGPVCDGVLKSDDGQVLDWLFDRQPVPGVPGLSVFLQPVADQWREVLIRAVLFLATKQRVPLPVLWLYPRNLPALGHLSHDSDGNDPSNARRLMDVLERARVSSTWCVLPPGYPPEVIDAIRKTGHELGMHYDAVSEGTHWSEDDFDTQWKALVEAFGGERPVTNKNHYLRWEGDTEFLDWCARRGIRLDESKGVSKTGEAGFNFGTCHPYFPVNPRGETIDILELPTPTQDLIVFAPEEIADLLLAAALKHYGVLHLLFHPAHIEKPGVAEALLGIVSKAKAARMEFWTARRINDWERARRAVCWSGFELSRSGASVRLRADTSMPDASVMWLVSPGSTVRLDGVEQGTESVECWGFPFVSITFDPRPGEEHLLEVVF